MYDLQSARNDYLNHVWQLVQAMQDNLKNYFAWLCHPVFAASSKLMMQGIPLLLRGHYIIHVARCFFLQCIGCYIHRVLVSQQA